MSDIYLFPILNNYVVFSFEYARYCTTVYNGVDSNVGINWGRNFKEALTL